MNDIKEWYVRMSDGNVYGPADVAALVSWAEDGRVDPSSSLSKDRIKWTPAQLMPELEMEWLVENVLHELSHVLSDIRERARRIIRGESDPAESARKIDDECRKERRTIAKYMQQGCDLVDRAAIAPVVEAAME